VIARVAAESRAAIGLLTRIPVATASVDRPGAAAFGIVGALLAGVAAIPLVILAGPIDEPVLGSIAAIAVLMVLTGAMHLDGLADTADALVARDVEAAERARKDPAVGPGGLASVVLVLAADVAALTSIATTSAPIHAAWTLVAAAGVSRVLPVLLVWATPQPATPDGFGSWFASRISTAEVIVALVTAVAVVVGLGIATRASLAIALAVGAAAGGVVTWLVALRRGSLDGDVLGASVELALVSMLGAAAIAIR
jgi:adenosylcobinamide-GDP ribazoletransferase